MADSGFDETLGGFRRWADTAERQLSGAPETGVAELGMLFDLMRDYLRMEDLSRLAEGDLTRLLLDVYPCKVTVLHREDASRTIPGRLPSRHGRDHSRDRPRAWAGT